MLATPNATNKRGPVDANVASEQPLSLTAQHSKWHMAVIAIRTPSGRTLAKRLVPNKRLNAKLPVAST